MFFKGVWYAANEIFSFKVFEKFVNTKKLSSFSDRMPPCIIQILSKLATSYDLNFNQIDYDTKLDIATKLLRLDSKDLTVEKISTIIKLPFYEIKKLYKQKYIR